VSLLQPRRIQHLFAAIAGLLIILIALIFLYLEGVIERQSAVQQRATDAALFDMEVRAIETTFLEIRLAEQSLLTGEFLRSAETISGSVDRIRAVLEGIDTERSWPVNLAGLQQAVDLLEEYEQAVLRYTELTSALQAGRQEITRDFQALATALLRAREARGVDTLFNLLRVEDAYLHNGGRKRLQTLLDLLSELRQRVSPPSPRGADIHPLIQRCSGALEEDFRLLEKVTATREELETLSDSLGEALLAISADARRVFLAESQRARAIRASLSRRMIASGVLAMLFLLLILLFMARKVISPLRQLSEVVARVKGGDIHARFISSSKDEIAQLGFALNEMLATIEENNSRLLAYQKDLEIKVEQVSEARRAAELASESKGEFLANMSHEIRTPMNAIIGNAALALETELTEEQREYLTMIRSASDSLLSIINDILDFSKIEAGELQLAREEFKLEECIFDAVSTLAIKASEKGLELINDYAPDLPTTVIGDRLRLRQILINLLSNAIKFTDEGEITVRTRAVAREQRRIKLMIDVEDTGMGIREEAQQQIFIAFKQADGSHTRRYGGTGLGLTIASQLARMMGGEVAVASQLGKGSTFWFTAYLELGHGQSPRREGAPPLQLGIPRALVVDDNESQREAIAALLRHWGIRTQGAASAPDAWDLAQTMSRELDGLPLVLIDTDLGSGNSFELARRIRSLPQFDGQIIMIGPACLKRLDSELCRAANLKHHLIKPIQRRRLLEALIDHGEPETPSETAETPELHPEHNATAEIRPLRILVAEDNELNRTLTVRMLQKLGHYPEVAHDGYDVLRLLRDRSYDLILMDVQMPRMSGIDATMEIRRREQSSQRHTPIVALTAHAIKGTREWCLTAGMDGYIAKPIYPWKLQNAIIEVMSRFEAPTSAMTQPAPPPPVPPLTTRIAPNPEPPPPSPAREILDQRLLIQSVDGDLQLLAEIAQLFESRVPELLEQARAAQQTMNREALADAAHSLSGIFGSTGGSAALAASRELESAARTAEPDQLARLIENVSREGQLLLQRLLDLTRQLQ
jgi:signal transduction histidine kinase